MDQESRHGCATSSAQGLSLAVLRVRLGPPSFQGMIEEAPLLEALKWVLEESVSLGLVGLENSVPHWPWARGCPQCLAAWALPQGGLSEGMSERARGDAQDGKCSLFIT